MKRSLLLTITSVIAYLALSSYSNGIAQFPNSLNRTGAGGSVANCAGSGCHAGNGGLSVDITMYDIATNTIVSNGKYIPNKPYRVRISAQKSIGGGGSFPEFGFQFTAERGAGQGAGNYFSNPGMQANPVPPFVILEHANPLPATGSNSIIFNINWIAPGPGSGDVKLWATVLASNDNGFADGDLTDNTSRIYQEGAATGIADLGKDVQTKLYPVPATDVLNLSLTGAAKGSYQLLVYGQNGTIAVQKTILVSSDEFSTHVNTATLAAGNYFVLLSKDGKQRIIPFMKQ